MSSAKGSKGGSRVRPMASSAMAANVVKLNCDAARRNTQYAVQAVVTSTHLCLCDSHRLNVHAGGQLMAANHTWHATSVACCGCLPGAPN